MTKLPSCKSLFAYVGVLLFSFFFLDVLPPGPDSMLYYGLAQNIIEGYGFVDTIRNDEILPPVGYPLLIVPFVYMGVKGGVFAYSSFFVSLLLILEGFRALRLKLYTSVLIVIALIVGTPRVHEWGIELGLMITCAAVFYGAVQVYIRRGWGSILFFSMALFFAVIVRPIFFPLLVVISLGLGLIFIKYRYKLLFVGLCIFWGAWSIVMFSSNILYGDSRLVTGTYSAIPLYCAWNPYIPLEKKYTSSVWGSVSHPLAEKGLMPLRNLEGWRERDLSLKKEVLKFIWEHPYDAIKGYVWRLSKYTFAADSKAYIGILLVYILSVLLVLFRRRKLNMEKLSITLLLITIGVYTVMISAVFVYVGERYYIFPEMVLLVLLGWLLSILTTIYPRLQFLGDSKYV